MKIAFYGSSLLSSYWNGAATYYRGLLKALAAHGHEITFHEPDAFDRQAHRDMDEPHWARVVVWEASAEGLRGAAARAAQADVVVKASGVGYADDALLEAVMDAARADAVKLFWDVDAPATLAEMAADESHAVRRMLPRLDAVMTYGGGQPVVTRYEGFGARACRPIYNALDPDTHHPVTPNPRFSADLAFLGNRMPDREARVRTFFLEPAAAAPKKSFLLGGSGWEPWQLTPNVRAIGHVGQGEHNAFNVTPKAVLNVTRESMAHVGFSPPTRVFEAAGAGACLITDDWEGVAAFFAPGEEILVARDGADVAEIMARLTPDDARRIGGCALDRALRDHTYARRAVEADAILRALAGAKGRAGAAA
ncbi:CgeB family protein [Salinarimonas chemoclinalis]|uniref:CgeB family protein n=1 Tax=Salinarimonas chemoclinalis TaxID=3241599 RepID=UPI00355827C5